MGGAARSRFFAGLALPSPPVAPLPISGTYDASEMHVQVVFDKPLVASGINEGRWNGRGSGTFAWNAVTASASSSQVDIDFIDGGEDVPGPTATYLGGDGQLRGANGVAVAAFNDFPLTLM